MTKIALFTAAFILAASVVFSAPVPVRDEITPWVGDPSGLLTPLQRAELDKLCVDKALQDGINMGIILLASLDKQPIEDFAAQAFKSWNMGNNGVLVVVSKGDRKTYIRTGSQVSPKLTPTDATKIASSGSSIPFLKNGDFSGASKALINDVSAQVGSMRKQPAATAQAVQQVNVTHSTGWFWLAVLCSGFGVALFLVYKKMTRAANEAKVEAEKAQRAADAAFTQAACTTDVDREVLYNVTKNKKKPAKKPSRTDDPRDLASDSVHSVPDDWLKTHPGEARQSSQPASSNQSVFAPVIINAPMTTVREDYDHHHHHADEAEANQGWGSSSNSSGGGSSWVEEETKPSGGGGSWGGFSSDSGGGSSWGSSDSSSSFDSGGGGGDW